MEESIGGTHISESRIRGDYSDVKVNENRIGKCKYKTSWNTCNGSHAQSLATMVHMSELGENSEVEVNKSRTEKYKPGTIWSKYGGFPTHIVAPMVDMSELPFRMLCRRYGARLCFSPMYHAAKFATDPIYRQQMFTTCPGDRPLIVQFCANDPGLFTRAAEFVQDRCDGVDLNLGCPQTIAKRGHYGSFLQEDPELIVDIVSAAVSRLKVPVSCKIRLLANVDETVKYAKKLENAGAAALTVHGRTREQKGPASGEADWEVIREVKRSLSIPVIANGNINCLDDVTRCMEVTGCDGVMSAEGILHNPALFSGINPLVYDIALEFLALCEVYPIEHGHIRTHLFRIFAYCLPELRDIQENLGKANSLESLRDCCLAVKERLLGVQKEAEPQQEHDPVTPAACNGHTPGPGEQHSNVSHPFLSNTRSSDVVPVHPFLSKASNPEHSMRTLYSGEGSTGESDGGKMPEEKQLWEGEQESSAHVTSDYVMPVWLCHSRPRIKNTSSMMTRLTINETTDSTEGDADAKKLARSEKKRLYHEKRIEGQKLRRQRAKERKRERKSQPETENQPPVAAAHETSEGRVPKHEMREMIRQRLTWALESGQRVCVDLSMEDTMSRKEVSKLAQQLGRMYGINRAVEEPMHIILAGLNKSGYLYEECLRKCAGFENYLVTMHENAIVDVFNAADVVYLSPDSPNILEYVDPAKVYILGGLVDEHILKGQTQGLAEKNSITTARLPIDKYMQRVESGSNFKQVLSINQVFTILLEHRRSRDWTSALTAGMPPRHGYVPKNTAADQNSE